MPALSGSIILAKTGVFDFGAANHLLRYVSPFCQAVLVFCLINDGKLKLQISMKDRRLQLWLLLFCYSLYLNAVDRYRVTERYYQMKVERDRNEALHSPVIALDDIRNAQAAVPKGQTIYARLSRANLLNFERNPIFVVDLPNQLSPTHCLKELPIESSAFAQYLINQNIDYVLYNYKNEGGYPRTIFGKSMSHPWDFYSSTARQSFAMSDQLKLLMQTHRQVFNNGAQVVIDLRAPVKALP